LVLLEEIESEMLPPMWNVKHLRLHLLHNVSEVDTGPALMESLRWKLPRSESLVISSGVGTRRRPALQEKYARNTHGEQIKRKDRL